MTLPIVQRPTARLDLLEQYIYLAENYSVESADAFFDAVNSTCRRISQFPHSAAPYKSSGGEFTGVRLCRWTHSRTS